MARPSEKKINSSSQSTGSPWYAALPQKERPVAGGRILLASFQMTRYQKFHENVGINFRHLRGLCFHCSFPICYKSTVWVALDVWQAGTVAKWIFLSKSLEKVQLFLWNTAGRARTFWKLIMRTRCPQINLPKVKSLELLLLFNVLRFF